ncbi:MAG: cyclophilin-like fold protein [Syntrophobacteraceae bacterium]
MSRRIQIRAGAISLAAELNDSPTALALYEALPIAARASTWGDEIYFKVPVDQRLDETAAELVEMGDLGYWPTGRAFCVFFGPTPVSRGAEIRPASAVNVVGRVIGDPRALKAVREGDLIELDAAR